jgi:hypothetical protein
MCVCSCDTVPSLCTRELQESTTEHQRGWLAKHATSGNPVQEPDWGNANLSFYDIPNSEEIRIEFKNKQSGIGGPLGGSDEDLGYVTIEVNDVRHSKYRHQRGSHFEEYEMLDADSGYVSIETLFVAYF